MVNAQCQNKRKVVTGNNSAYNISQYKLTQAHTQEGTNYPDTRTWNLSPNGERGGQVERREKILSIVFEKNVQLDQNMSKIVWRQFQKLSLVNSTICNLYLIPQFLGGRITLNSPMMSLCILLNMVKPAQWSFLNQLWYASVLCRYCVI